MVKYKLIGSNDYIFSVMSTFLENRGITDSDKFLNLDESVEIHYSNLKNINEAVKCINKHIRRGSRILNVTDSDVDGYTASATLINYLKLLSEEIGERINIEWVLHEKKTHGLKDITVDDGVDLVVVPDAGSGDFEEHLELYNRGIEVLVLDHHEVEKESKHAIVVNPHLGGYDNYNLSGVGIVYKFCQALDDYYNISYADDFLDLVALGNIADSMDMREPETRYYVQKGLSDINNSFFNALLRSQEYSIKGEININSISFYISPLINATIRIGTLEEKGDLFKAFLEEKKLIEYRGQMVSFVDDMARRCKNIKAKQKRIVDKVIAEVKGRLQQYDDDKVVIINDLDNVDNGIKGLVAMKVATLTQKPTMILTINEDGIYSGSARGYDKGELTDFKSVVNKSELFNFAEGHASAFGVSIDKENLKRATHKLNELLDDYNFENFYRVDFEIPSTSINADIIKDIYNTKSLWGKGIDEPLIVVKDISLDGKNLWFIGKNENTMKIYLNDIHIIKFSLNDEIKEKLQNSNKISVIGKASLNEYMGEKTYQLIVEEFIFD